MLRKETVSRGTLELLTNLMKDDRLQEFFLVGGTALSLQIGHRISVDIDLFSINPFDVDLLLDYLEDAYEFRLDFQAQNTLKGQIKEVKVDFLSHGYPLVKLLIVDEDIRMASLEDISAMKLNAISGTGTRLKDFIDIAYLSSHISLAQMIDAYAEKYSSRNPVMIIKALDFHNDIDFNDPIHMLDGKYSWKKVNTRLRQMIQNPQKLFE